MAPSSLTRENYKRGVISVLRFCKLMQEKEIDNQGETPLTPPQGKVMLIVGNLDFDKVSKL